MKTLSLLKISILIAALFLSLNAKSQNSSLLLSPAEFELKIKSLPAAPVVDIRTPGEYEKGHIPGAVNINWLGGDFESRVVAYDTSSPILIYCLGGGRSASAAAKMKEMGFKEIYELDGGLLKWRAASLAEVRTIPDLPGMTRRQYDELVNSNSTVMIVFFADWCGLCSKLKPVVNEIAHDVSLGVSVYWINVEDNRDLIKELNIDAIPVVRIYKDHLPGWMHTGLADKEEILEQIQ